MDEATKDAARAKVQSLTRRVHHKHDSLPDLIRIWKEFNYFFAFPFFAPGLIDCSVRWKCVIEYIKGLTLRSEDRLIRIFLWC